MAYDFKEKVVVITGGARGIGKCIAEQFKKEGANVCIIDLLENEYYVGDISKKEVLENFVKKVIKDYGHIDYLINNAAPLKKGISDTFTYPSCTTSNYYDFFFKIICHIYTPSLILFTNKLYASSTLSTLKTKLSIGQYPSFLLFLMNDTFSW